MAHYDDVKPIGEKEKLIHEAWEKLKGKGILDEKWYTLWDTDYEDFTFGNYWMSSSDSYEGPPNSNEELVCTKQEFLDYCEKMADKRVNAIGQNGNDGLHYEKENEEVAEWSIYNNDKLMPELTDEQAAELFNAWRGGKKIRYFSYFDKEWLNICNPCWDDKHKYRVDNKQSPRDKFIKQCCELMTVEIERADYVMTDDMIFGEIYDAIKSGDLEVK